MLSIRQAQMDVLGKAASEKFLGVLEQHLRAHVPALVEGRDLAEIRAFNLGIWERARQYALFSELGVCGYLNAVLVFGEQFETQPPYAWAKTILTDDIPEAVKIERLKGGTQACLERLAREEGR